MSEHQPWPKKGPGNYARAFFFEKKPCILPKHTRQSAVLCYLPLLNPAASENHSLSSVFKHLVTSFTINKLGKVKLFRGITATPTFLEKHGVATATSSESLDVIGCRSRDGILRLYLVDPWQVRVADLSMLDRVYEEVNLLLEGPRPAALAQLKTDYPYETLSEQLYYRDNSCQPTQRCLLSAAHAAVVAAGVHPLTANWLDKYFALDTFFWGAGWQEFTDYGVRRPPRSFRPLPLPRILKRLDQLQQHDIMRYEVLPKAAGVYLRFNRHYLPGLDSGKTPLFFETFLY